MGDTAYGHDWLDDELRRDALHVLREVADWRLVGWRWPAVESVLATMNTALVEDDAAGFRTAVHDLELSGPTRAVPFPNDPAIDPPQPVMEQFDELIHTLDGRQAPPDER